LRGNLGEAAVSNRAMTTRADDGSLGAGPSLGPTPPHPAGAQDAVDPELLALPAPPRGRRTLSMALLCAVAIGAAALVLHLRADVAYSFASDKVSELGEATHAKLGELVPNSYVRVHGTPMLSRMVRFERGLGDDYAIFPLAGQHQIYVQVPLAALSDPARAAQAEWSGRLLTFGQLGGRLRAVRQYLAAELGMPVTAESYVVLAEEPPSAYGWSIALCALGLAIMGVSLTLLVRWFRGIRQRY
jgi:hypothetical protein